MMTVSEIKSSLNIQPEPSDNAYIIHELCIDTRRIINPEHTLFIAIAGDRRDGHAYIKDAYQKGVRYFLVHQSIDYTFEDVTVFIQVPDTIQALQQIATNIRQQFTYPVIAITGSNGKTIVKEWIARILSQIAPFNEGAGVVKSPKSYNSQIGVPMSVWLMQADHTIGIFEAGISKVDEMQQLEHVLLPTIGLFTNIGDAHSEFFSNKEQKIAEKFALFEQVSTLILHIDKPIVQAAVRNLQEKNPSVTIFDWSYTNRQSTVFIQQLKKGNRLCQINYLYKNEEHSILIPFTQDAYIENAINVLCVLLHLEVEPKLIREQMLYLKAVAMRLELRDAINNSYIIADTYNSDLSSLKVGLEFLSQQIGKKRTIVLSDMKESGKSQEVLIREIIQYFNLYKVEKAIIIGAYAALWKTLIPPQSQIDYYFYENTEDFLSNYTVSFFHHEFILLKGARVFEFEKIQMRLEMKIHQTVLEVDLESVAYNLNVYKKYLNKNTKLMAMVKAHSYGSGSLEIAQRLQYEGVDYLAVAYVDEGIELRMGGVTLPIMVMSPEIHSFDSMIRWQLEPEIFNIASLKLFIEEAGRYQEMHYPIHIKLDTGMHRLGFEAQDLDALIDILSRSESVKVASVFSHLVGSDDVAFDAFTALQFERFQSMSEHVERALAYTFIKHINNSAGIINHTAMQCDMVRLGIGLYGIDSSASIQAQLKNVSTLKTYIVQLRKVPAGDTIGYSRKGVVHRDCLIATVAIGYADGYIRAFGQGVGYMLVNGQPAPIIGNICMDMCMLDVTDINGVQEGDEVIVFGDGLSVHTLAEWASTIPYEILTNISRRVKRIYVGT